MHSSNKPDGGRLVRRPFEQSKNGRTPCLRLSCIYIELLSRSCFAPNEADEPSAPPIINSMRIHNVEVFGTDVDAQTRCAHYHSDIDVIAIKFKCCGKWFPCYECHAEYTDHQPQVWLRGERDTPAILCGVCGHQLTITEYFGCAAVCPNCRSQFNPGCANHYDLYFETDF